MNINKIDGPGQTVRPTRHVRSERGNNFADVLEKTVAATVGEGPLADPPIPVCGMLPAGCVETPSADSLTIQKASDMLNLLESYGEALRDSKRSLKSIEPMVGQIRDQIQALKVRAQGQDEGLLKLVDQIAVTATVETLKFQRGDYIA
jgi:hypothetical protein